MEIIYNPSQAKKYNDKNRIKYSYNFIEKPITKKYLKNIINKDLTILDAGCGSGRSTKLLINLGATPKNITGIDISPTLIEYAKDMLPDVHFINTSLNKATLTKESFDLITSTMVFHHLSRRVFKQSLKKLTDALKPKGYLFFITLHPFRFAHDHNNYHADLPKYEKTNWGTDILYYHKTFNDYIGLLLENNLELIALEEPVPKGKEAKENKTKFQKHTQHPTRLVVLTQKKL